MGGTGTGGGGCTGGCSGGGTGIDVREGGDVKDNIGGNVEPESEENGGSVDIDGSGTVEKFDVEEDEDTVMVGYGSATETAPYDLARGALGIVKIDIPEPSWNGRMCNTENERIYTGGTSEIKIPEKLRCGWGYNIQHSVRANCPRLGVLV